MISAALVTTPALEATPSAIASRGDDPRGAGRRSTSFGI
jgi:hypothetical protein